MDRAKSWTNRINAGTAENVEVDSERRIFAGCGKQGTAAAPSWRRNLIADLLPALWRKLAGSIHSKLC